MKIATILLPLLFLGLIGCSDSSLDSKTERILGLAELELIEVSPEEHVEVHLLVTVNGSDIGTNGTRMVTSTPFALKTESLIGIQIMSSNRLGLFLSDGGPTAISWVLDDIGPLGGSRMISGAIRSFSQGPRILFSQTANPAQGRPAIQVFLVSDLSSTPYYDDATDEISIQSGPENEQLGK